MRTPRIPTLLTAAFATALLAASVPTGLDVIFKNVESGQRFHPFWPPVSGKQVLGTVVIAKTPGKPKAYFQTIDSPSYRNPAYTKAFAVGQLELNAPDLTSERTISADVAFSQLDSIGKALAKPASGDNLQGNASASSVSCQSTSQKAGTKTTNASATQQTSSKTPASGNTGGGSSDVTANPPGNGNGATGSSSNGAAQSANGGGSSGNSTGIDFCRFTNATSKITGLKVIYYDLPTLIDLTSGIALQPSAQQLVKKGSSGWIVHRALVVDSIEYTLTANSAVDAGFFAKLITWIPTVSVGYNNQTTVTLKTTSPLTIGYKLWQAGLSPEGKEVMDSGDLAKVGIGSDAIDALLKRGTR